MSQVCGRLELKRPKLPGTDIASLGLVASTAVMTPLLSFVTSLTSGALALPPLPPVKQSLPNCQFSPSVVTALQFVSACVISEGVKKPPSNRKELGA